jgi:hypothetical protein
MAAWINREFLNQLKKSEGFSDCGCFTQCMDDELRKKLALWKVDPQIPPDFQRDVWQKIAAVESRSSKSPLSGLWNIAWLSVPRLATCAIILGAFGGTGLGLIESSQANSRSWKSLETKYVQSIDPYQHLQTY